jgi:hypothetical protein
MQSHLPTVMIRNKPTMKWGAMIAVTGALIGGILGVTMRNERIRHAAELAQAANAVEAPPTPVPVAVATLAGPTVIPSQPPLPPPQALAAVPPQQPIIVPPPPVKAAPPPPQVKRAAPVFHAAAPPAPPPPRPNIVATKVNTPPPPPPPVKETKPTPPKTKDNAEALDLLKRAQAESGASL